MYCFIFVLLLLIFLFVNCGHEMVCVVPPDFISVSFACLLSTESYKTDMLMPNTDIVLLFNMFMFDRHHQILTT